MNLLLAANPQIKDEPKDEEETKSKKRSMHLFNVLFLVKNNILEVTAVKEESMPKKVARKPRKPFQKCVVSCTKEKRVAKNKYRKIS